MKVVDVYSQYFEAASVYNGVPRKGALVTLTSTYNCGNIQYDVSVNFFPYRDPEDFAVSYDAYACTQIYSAAGRRSKKREAGFLLQLREYADTVAAGLGGTIYWDRPLREARYG